MTAGASLVGRGSISSMRISSTMESMYVFHFRSCEIVEPRKLKDSTTDTTVYYGEQGKCRVSLLVCQEDGEVDTDGSVKSGGGIWDLGSGFWWI